MKVANKLKFALVAFAAFLSLASCSRAVSIRSAADLEGKKVGVREGTTSETWVNENLRKAKIYSYKTGADAAVDLMKGAIDAVVIDELPAREIVSLNSGLEIVADAETFAREEYAIAVRKGNEELLEAINTAIGKLIEGGEYDILASSFMPADGNITIPSFDMPEQEGTIMLGTNPSFPPFEYTEGSETVGFDISLGQLIARECGANLEVVNMDFDSLIPALAFGEIDFVAAGLTVTEERQKTVDFSVPYFASEQVIIVRK